MPMLSSVTYVSSASALKNSHITDLILHELDGTQVLYATTRLDGVISAWSVAGTDLSQIDSAAYDLAATVGGRPRLVIINDALLTAGAVGQMALRPLIGSGQIDTPVSLGAATTFLGALGQLTTVAGANGTTHVYGQITGTNGIGQLLFSDTGTLLQSGTTTTPIVGAITSATIGTTSYVISVGAQDNTLNTWAVYANGGLTGADSIDPENGLWISAPTALGTAIVDGQTYLVLGRAGSNSLSVLHMDPTGGLTITDHLLDNRYSRFGGVTTLDVVTVGGHTYVIAGGADDGISVYQLVTGGQLIARAHLADTTTTGIANIAAITSAGDATGITIFVASSSETGITQLRFDIGPAGVNQNASAMGGTLVGTVNFDMLIGGAGADQIDGGAGDDIIYDGENCDLLTGGEGADVFVFASDQTADVIMDFTPGEDLINQSAWADLRSVDQLFFSETNQGLQITYGDETLLLVGSDGITLTPSMLQESDLLGTSRLPQTIIAGFAGPVVTSALPDQPVITTFDPPISQEEQSLDLRGTGCNNYLKGADTDDTLWGFAGNDALYGLEGDDQLFGGSGVDAIYGGAGNDILLGGSGRDTNWADGTSTRTQDTLIGGQGDDQLFGQSGADLLSGEQGNDTLTGAEAAIRLFFLRGVITLPIFPIWWIACKSMTRYGLEPNLPPKSSAPMRP